MIRAIVFDLDNTLVDFMSMKRLAVAAAINAMIDTGLPLDRDTAEREIFAIYAREGIEGSIVLDLPAGRYRTEWIDTQSGDITASDELNHSGGPTRLASPKFSNDIALRIVAPPGSNPSSN